MDDYDALIDEVIDEALDDYDPDYLDAMDREQEAIEREQDGYYDEPVTIEERRAMGDDMLYPTYNIFGEWE